MDVVDGFAQLFEGRVDACGTPHGGCLRVLSSEFHLLWERHLNGAAPLGIYPVRPGNMCRWGAIDFDIKSEAHRSWDYESEDEAHLAAVNLQSVCRHLGVTAWIERTRSSGRHVWVFADSWCSASVMRRALLVACSVAGVSTREVNPKQETLAEGQVGSYVRLPYPGGRGACPRTQIVVGANRNVGYRLPQFVEAALAARTSPQTLEAIAAKWRAPEPTLSAIDWGTRVTSLDVTLVSRLSATGRSVFTNGPNDGDRSRGMVYLAKQAKLSGLTPHEALTLLRGVHWNKYRNRRDEEIQLRNIVSRAWA